ncbi:MAG TPA: response regulator transcription factor [Terriglobia bacterium]|nr:response regulator transcription factor [Terriglobia bacterium]
MAGQKKIRVLIADNRPVFRKGLRLLLQKEPDIQVVGEADQPELMVKKTTSLKPNVLLLHARLGEVDGHAVLRQLHRNNSKLRFLVLVSNEQDEIQAKAFRVPSLQIVPKHAPCRLLVQWIREEEGAAKGEATADVPAAETGARQSPPQDSSPLSARERQVVELVSQGFKNREIAQRMFISEQTVKNHLHNIFDKLGVSDRLELALYAIHKNLQAGG